MNTKTEDRQVRDQDVPALEDKFVRLGREMIRRELENEFDPAPFKVPTVGERVRALERRQEMTEQLVYGGLVLLVFIFLIAVRR